MNSAIYQSLARPLRFGLVGLSGVVVNTAALWGLARGAGLPVLLASVLATEMAILSNFLLNDRWTFRAEARRARTAAAALQRRGARRHGDHHGSAVGPDRLRGPAAAARQSVCRRRRDDLELCPE